MKFRESDTVKIIRDNAQGIKKGQLLEENTMNIKRGIIKINTGLVVSPNFTFEQFKETKFYTNQDSNRIIYLDGMQTIENREYMVSLFFKNGHIYIISLICCEQEYSENDEYKRKDLHDLVLHEFGISESSKFGWGEIESVYDVRSNISSINIVYATRG